MKILIIEDERLLAQSLQLALQRRGFQVELAHDGETGAAYADTGVYDLLVLDIGLFCHSKKTRIPGTEDMDKEYRNPRHHIIGAGTGTIIGAVVALLSGGIIHVVSIYLLV